MSLNTLLRRVLNMAPMVMNPDWSPPNFVDPPSLVKITYGIGITSMTVTALAIVLRYISSFKLHARLAVHDCE